MLLELRAPAELGLFLGAAPFLQLAPVLPRPEGRGRPVLVMPGFVASDASTLPLRLLLQGLGHQPWSWGLGRNLGPTSEILAGIVRRLHEVVDKAGEPVCLVGWSLGGVYARGLALWYPDLVDQVISLGSPFNLSFGEQTSLDPIYGWLERYKGYARSRGEIDLDRIPRPSTAVYTRTDGVVAWESCRQTPGELAENVEVWGSHCGLGVNVTVAYVVADRLRHTGPTWRPFAPSPAFRPLFPAADPAPGTGTGRAT